MTDASTLEARLTTWCREFEAIGGALDRLPNFLARRIVESGLTTVTEDPDVVRIEVRGTLRRRRITGWDPQIQRLQFEEIEPGWFGMGLCPIAAVHREDHGKLGEILDRLTGKRP